jgi:plastocyanin
MDTYYQIYDRLSTGPGALHIGIPSRDAEVMTPPQGSPRHRQFLNSIGFVVLAALLTTSGFSAPSVAAAPAAVDGTIRGTVGPGFTITASRARVRPGTYRFVITDESTMHNWHITGPGGVNKKTTVTFVGTKRFTLTLRAGRYRIQCDSHPTSMFTTLRVRN